MVESVMPIRTPIYCDCCGTQIVAEVVAKATGNELVIIQKRNGRRHVANLLIKVKGST